MEGEIYDLAQKLGQGTICEFQESPHKLPSSLDHRKERE